MLFSDPHKLIDRHLDKRHFCVTASSDEAKIFAGRGRAGTIALRNDDTRYLSRALAQFNAVYGDKRLSDRSDREDDKELRNAMEALMQAVIGNVGLCYSLMKPHLSFGWDEAAHTDKDRYIGLLPGATDRPTEVRSLSPVGINQFAAKPRDKDMHELREHEWGVKEMPGQPGYARHAPISFLAGTLLIFLGSQQRRRDILHRIPRRLYEGETRGFILKAY